MLTVHVVPIPSISAWNGFVPPSGVAGVFVIDPLRGAADVDGFASAYGLTAAERRVLREIVQCAGFGGRSFQAARRGPDSTNTIAAHIREDQRQQPGGACSARDDVSSELLSKPSHRAQTVSVCCGPNLTVQLAAV